MTKTKQKDRKSSPQIGNPACGILCDASPMCSAAPVEREGVPAAAVAMAAVYRRVHESTRLSSWLVALETGGCEVKMFEDDLEDSG